jgi:hypothetical protein
MPANPTAASFVFSASKADSSHTRDAQNGPATGGQRPVAGGANGGGWGGGWYGGAPAYGYGYGYSPYGGGWYGGAPGYGYWPYRYR